MSALPIISKSNGISAKQPPVLSVLIPFFRDDPSELLTALAAISNKSVEILLYDDGTQDADLTARITHALNDAKCPITLLTVGVNKGRSFGRNYLFNTARADWVLFLDADMRPIDPKFLDNYTKLIEADKADIIFGGFKVATTRGAADTEIHRVMSLTSDCESASQRQVLGPKNVASSNLCVRKIVLKDAPFDDKFTGWGWEDSEWAARASKIFSLLHIDNPALHIGLETTDTLLSRFKTSGHNYARFTHKHPEIAKSLPLYQWIIALKKRPAHKVFRPALKTIVKLPIMPIRLRINALKLWRASWYSEAMK